MKRWEMSNYFMILRLYHLLMAHQSCLTNMIWHNLSQWKIFFLFRVTCAHCANCVVRILLTAYNYFREIARRKSITLQSTVTMNRYPDLNCWIKLRACSKWPPVHRLGVWSGKSLSRLIRSLAKSAVYLITIWDCSSGSFERKSLHALTRRSPL